MKKLIANALVGTMALSLVACGNASAPQATESAPAQPAATEATAKAEETQAAPTDTSGEATSITLWTYPIGSWGDSATVDTLVADFNSVYPNITVTVEYLDYTNGDDQVNTAIEGGQAPDMVMEGPERLVANWGAKGYMVDLRDIMAEDAASDLYDSVKSACTASDGSVYEYPLVMVAHCMAVNKTIMEKADAMQYINEDTHTWKSTDDFLKAVQAIYDSGHQDVLAVYCAGQGGDQGTRALINNLYGGTYTNPEHTKYTADSPENIKALETLKAQKGVNFDASLVGGDEIQLFRQGVLAMSLCWNAAMQNNTDNGPAGTTNNGDEIIPLNFPTSSGNAKLCGGIWGFGVFDNGNQAKIDAAKTFIEYMCNSDETATAVKAAGYFPVHKNLTGVYDGTDNAASMAIFTKDFMPNLGDYYQVVPGWAEARTEWWNMLQRIGSGGDVATEVGTFVTNANAAAAAAK